MEYPKFYDDVKTIKLKDNLSDFLGSAKNGVVEISYLEIVKMAGHSCPTVAGAYLMTLKALKSLYPDSFPVRGEIKIEFSEDVEQGVIGVISNVITNITGACLNAGFKGIGEKFSRNGLLGFNVSDVASIVRFTRVDTGYAVDVTYNSDVVESNPRVNVLMQKAMQGVASDAEVAEFKEMWQGRVKRILIDNFDNLELVVVSASKNI